MSISDTCHFDLFPNLEPLVMTPVADTGGQSAAPGGFRKAPIQAESQLAPGAPGVRSARPTRKQRESIIAYGQKIVAKRIIELMGGDVPCAKRFQKYLEKQSLTDLIARLNQLQTENQRELGEPWEMVRERIAARMQIMANRSAARRLARKAKENRL